MQMTTDIISARRASRSWGFAALAAAIIAAIAIAMGYQEHLKIGQLSAALESANAGSAQLRQQVSQLQLQVSELEQKASQQTAALQSQSSVIQAEAKPDLPLSVGFRAALLGTGRVMILRNNSGRYLDLAVIVTSTATGLVQRREVGLPANRVVQLGSAQGWSLVPGQRVVFRNADFRPGAVVVR